MSLALFRRDKFLDPIAEKDTPHLIVVLGCRKSQHRRDLGNHVFLELRRCSEHSRPAHIDQQHHGQLPFLFKNLDMGLTASGGNVPVDIAHIVADLVLTHFTERHTPSLERAMVLSGKDIVAQTARLDFDPTHLFQNIAAVFHKLHLRNSSLLIFTFRAPPRC